MEKNATIFLTEDEATSFVKKILEMKPGTYMGERDGAKYYFYKVSESPLGLMVDAVAVKEDTQEYNGQRIFNTAAATMTAAGAASLLGMGLAVNSEDVK